MALSFDKTVLSTAFSTVFQNSIEVSGCHTLTGLCKHKLPLHYFMRIKNDMELKIISKNVCPRWGSNSRPSDYETDALPTALRRQDIKALQLISPWQPGESPASELKKYTYKSTKVIQDEFVAFLAYETCKSEGLIKHFSFAGFEPEIFSVHVLKYFDFPMFLYSVTSHQKSCCQKWDSNPRPHQRTRNLH